MWSDAASDVIPIQQRQRDAIFVRGKPRSPITIAGIDGPDAIEFVDLRSEACSPTDFFVTIHRYAAGLVICDEG
jgi:hypothetical protein